MLAKRQSYIALLCITYALLYLHGLHEYVKDSMFKTCFTSVRLELPSSSLDALRRLQGFPVATFFWDRFIE